MKLKRISPEYLLFLEGLAKQAKEQSPSPWIARQDDDSVRWYVVDFNNTIVFRGSSSGEETQFASSVDPITVLSLVARIRQLEEQVAVLSKIERDRWLQTAKMLGIKPEDVGYGQG